MEIFKAQLWIRFSRKIVGMWPLWCHFSGGHENLGWWNYGRRISVFATPVFFPHSVKSPHTLVKSFICFPLFLAQMPPFPFPLFTVALCPLLYPFPLAPGAGKQKREGLGLGLGLQFSSWWKLIPSETDLGKVPSSCSQKHLTGKLYI